MWTQCDVNVRSAGDWLRRSAWLPNVFGNKLFCEPKGSMSNEHVSRWLILNLFLSPPHQCIITDLATPSYGSICVALPHLQHLKSYTSRRRWWDGRKLHVMVKIVVIALWSINRSCLYVLRLRHRQWSSAFLYLPLSDNLQSQVLNIVVLFWRRRKRYEGPNQVNGAYVSFNLITEWLSQLLSLPDMDSIKSVLCSLGSGKVNTNVWTRW